jgi:HEAT repeat protein
MRDSVGFAEGTEVPLGLVRGIGLTYILLFVLVPPPASGGRQSSGFEATTGGLTSSARQKLGVDAMGDFLRHHKKLTFFAIMLAGTVVFWWGRAPVMRWYVIQRLAQADDSQRSEWALRVAGLDAAAMSGLIDLLRRNDAKVCANSSAALAALEKRWGAGDSRTAKLADNLYQSFSSLSMPGCEAALEWYLALLSDAGGKPGPVADRCRDLAAQGLASKHPEVRAGAIRLVTQPPLNTEKQLLDEVAPFLGDPSAEVRRAAVLALGLAEDVVTVEHLLPLLQDGDAEVRRLSEGALRGRGLQDNHIKLAKLITDPHPGQRLQVVHYLSQAEDLDPAIWLFRLSQDPSPAVRAAAVRFAAEKSAGAGSHDRLVQMSQDDPSPSVRQLAAYYLNRRK